jgi:hypothetical protein
MMYFKVLDSHTCIGSLGLSYNFMDKLKGSTWDDILFDSVENTFELHEDMNLCSLNYYCWITSTDLTFELLDEDGTKIFSQIVNGEEDGWGGMNFYLNELNYPLKAKTKYVLVCSSNVAKSNWFLRTSNESLLSFPIDLGHWSLLDASISKDGVEYPKTGFVPIQLGFVD